MKLPQLLEALSRAEDLQAAATACLPAMLEVVQEALSASAYAQTGRLKRAIVHIRPDGAYRGLVSLERGSSQASFEESVELKPSLTAWRAVESLRTAVTMDVNLGLIAQLDNGKTWEPNASGQKSESMLRLLNRDTTHLCLFPIFAPGGALVGMISLEGDCHEALGKPFVWKDCEASLHRIAALAAPYLSTLPLGVQGEASEDKFLPVVGKGMSQLLAVLRVFAAQKETLLISGPTGSGKSRLARWCHENSERSGSPFEVVELQTVPEETQMGELFGWKRGAFTGALNDHAGFIQRAEGGTLFLDEIDKLSMRAQAGLLSLLEERSYRPLGDASKLRSADVRFIVGTNANLMERVQEGAFREDLYYRINVLPVRLPSLDERADEIPSWASFMLLRRHRERTSQGGATLLPEAASLLASKRWPGNLRQLDNVVRRAYSYLLLDGGAHAEQASMSAAHVQSALQHEVERSSSSIEQLLSAADAFGLECERAAASGEPFELSLAGGLTGLVLLRCFEREKDIAEVFKKLGKEAVVKSRNHRKTFKREVGLAFQLIEAMGADSRKLFPSLPDLG